MGLIREADRNRIRLIRLIRLEVPARAVVWRRSAVNITIENRHCCSTKELVVNINKKSCCPILRDSPDVMRLFFSVMPRIFGPAAPRAEKHIKKTNSAN